jgi:hypothetical protein
MTSSDIRKELHGYQYSADSESLNQIRETIIDYKARKQTEDREDVPVLPPVKPVTEPELSARIELSEENLKNGKYYTHQDVIAIMKSWK